MPDPSRIAKAGIMTAALETGASRPPETHSEIVSVLIPLYNHAKTIGLALDSVLLSSTAHIELIVSDDDSTDDSADIAEAWISKNGHRFFGARLKRQGSNLGITDNLNFLVQAAGGAFLTTLASDDELAAGAIDAQRAYLESHPDIDFVFANVQRIDDGGNVSGAYISDGRAKLLRHSVCFIVDVVLNWTMPWGRLFARRRPFLKIGPYLKEHSFEDRWSGLKIVETRRFAYLPRIVHLYRLRAHGNGTAGLETRLVLRDLRDVERRLIGETTGLVRSLLWLRVQSYREGGRSSLSRLFWLFARLSVAVPHRIAIRVADLLVRRIEL